MRRTIVGILGLLVLLTVLVAGCGAPAAPVAPVAPAAAAQPDAALPVQIDVATANQLRSQDDVLILDVRENDEYAAGHIPGATLVPLGQLASRLNELPRDKTIVAVCRSGNRSGQATQLLLQNGFDAHNMQGGMNAWQQAGFEVER